jgi:hypothetical protein
MKWTINKAASEFRCSRETLTRGLRANGHEVAKGNAFTTLQIHSALAGDLKFERVRRERAQADKLEMQNKIRDGQLVELPVAERELYFNLWLPIKQQLDLMPEQLAALCNPESPETARLVIFTHVEQIKSQMRNPKSNKP